jgi:uncharacterized protein (DUF1919 family)
MHPKSQLIELQETIYRSQLRMRTNRAPVSIVCNNCLGGFVYKDLGRQYETPFVGLFLYPDCFVRLATNFSQISLSDLQFVDASKYNMANRRRTVHGKYPIGILDGGIEIHFNHYESVEHARSIWMRRCRRVVSENLRFILVQRELCTTDLICDFLTRASGPSIAFVAFGSPSFRNAVPLRDCFGKPYVTDLVKYPQLYRSEFDMAAWLNTGKVTTSRYYRILVRFINAKRHDYRSSRETFVEDGTSYPGDKTECSSK